MRHLHIKNIEKYHPNYKDRDLIWCKVYFSMINSDPQFEMLCEIDQWRFVKFIMLEIQTKNPIPLDDLYLSRKGFDIKNRPITLTLIMLHNFIEVSESSVTQSRVDIREEKSREELDTADALPVTNPPVKVTKTETKSPYGETGLVMLTVAELEKLTAHLGEKRTHEYIQRLENYIGSTGKRYKSHYHTIMNWLGNDGLAEKRNGRDTKQQPEERREKLMKAIEEIHFES